MKAKLILDREFLEMRCRLIDLAASMDRIERGSDTGEVTTDPRLGLIRGAVCLLVDGHSDRAGRMQMHFSDAYSTDWPHELGVSSAKAGSKGS